MTRTIGSQPRAMTSSDNPPIRPSLYFPQRLVRALAWCHGRHLLAWLVFGMTLSKHNVHRVENTLRACQRECPGLGIEDFHLNVAQRSAHYYGNEEVDFTAPPADTRAALSAYRRMRRVPRSASAWVESRYLGHLDRYLATGATPLRCHALRSSCFINPAGDVFPCITDERKLGSLRATNMRLAPIWSSAAAREAQREIWAGECPQCWTACEAYQTILGNIVRRAPAGSARFP